jgi:hypothetical protein
MKNKLLLATAIVFTLFINCSKDKQDSSLCGAKTNSSKFWLRIGNSLFQNFDGLPHTYMEGNNRVFQWSDFVENACPHEHVKVACEVELSNAASPVSARGRIDWFILFEHKITMTRSGNFFKGTGDAGLKQAFDTDPASFSPVVEVFFPTKGSYSADSAFVLEHVAKVSFIADYRVYKQP